MRRILGLWRWALVVSAFASCGAPMPGPGTSDSSVVFCAGSTRACDGVCVNTASSMLHCGGCNRACPAGTLCRDGACEIANPCPTGATLCGGTCSQTMVDQNNCGACGNRCPSGSRCVGGECRTGCEPRMQCGTTCVDAQTDRVNCGVCGRRCSAEESCIEGLCLRPMPRCGDGMCNNGETCGTCPMDCTSDCATQCLACASSADCPTGTFCSDRLCDGTRGCYRQGDSTATCARIGGEACPTVSAYNLCTSQSECGPYATCSAYSDGRAICSRRCATDNDCPAPPGTSVGIFRRCDTGGGRCYLRCNGPGVCPFGLSCFRFADGTFGYCN